MHNFKNLKVWLASRYLVKLIYILSKKFPKEEIYGLTSQMRRAVISIPSNIAEGSAKKSQKEFARFLETSLASSFELETQLILSLDLEYITAADYNSLTPKLNEIQKILFTLIDKFDNK